VIILIYSDLSLGGPLNSPPVNAVFDATAADMAGIMIENVGYGVRTGLGAYAQSIPNMSIGLSAGTAYLTNGVRIPVLAQSNISFSNPTTVLYSQELDLVGSGGIVTTAMHPITDINGNYAGTGNVTVTLTGGTTVTVSAVNATGGTITTTQASGTYVKVTYYQCQYRTDTVALNNSGSAVVYQGTPSNTINPLGPTVPSPYLPIANVAISPKAAINISGSDITLSNIRKGMYVDSNFNTYVMGNLTVYGSTVAGTGNSFTTASVSNYLYNNLGGPVLISGGVAVTGSITIVSTGTIDGRTIHTDGANLDAHLGTGNGINPLLTDTTRIRHVSNDDMYLTYNHLNFSGNAHNMIHDSLLSIPSCNVYDSSGTDTTYDKHVCNSVMNVYQQHVADVSGSSPTWHHQLGTGSTNALRGDYGTIAYNHVSATGNVHSLSHDSLLNLPGVVVTLTDTTQDKHISNNNAYVWQTHVNDTASPQTWHHQIGTISGTAFDGGSGALCTAHTQAVSPHTGHARGTISITTSTTTPSSPGNGDVWLDSTNLAVKIYNTSTSAWIVYADAYDGDCLSFIEANYRNVSLSYTYSGNCVSSIGITGDITGTISYQWSNGIYCTQQKLQIISPYTKTVTINYGYNGNNQVSTEQRITS